MSPPRGRSRKPDYVLRAKPKDESQYGAQVGAAWKTEYGFDIVLQPGVVLAWNDNLYLNLIPRVLDPAKPKSEDDGA